MWPWAPGLPFLWRCRESARRMGAGEGSEEKPRLLKGAGATIRPSELCSGCYEAPGRGRLTPRSLLSRKGLHEASPCPGPPRTCPTQLTMGRSHLHTHTSWKGWSSWQEGSGIVTVIIVPMRTREVERRDFLPLKPEKVLESTTCVPNGFSNQ